MKVLANGEAYEVEEGTTLEGFLISMGLRGRWVAVERNGEPVAREDFSRVILEEGDRLEIVRPVAGG